MWSTSTPPQPHLRESVLVPHLTLQSHYSHTNSVLLAIRSIQPAFLHERVCHSFTQLRVSCRDDSGGRTRRTQSVSHIRNIPAARSNARRPADPSPSPQSHIPAIPPSQIRAQPRLVPLSAHGNDHGVFPRVTPLLANARVSSAPLVRCTEE